MQEQNAHKCYCLIPHPQRAALLIVRQGDHWSMPCLPASDSWFEQPFSQISDRVRDVYGFNSTVLRRLQRGKDFLVCELEVHSRTGAQSFDARWYDHERHLKSGELGIEADEMLSRWFKDRDSVSAIETRPGWERPGWFGEASKWICETLDLRNIKRLGPVSQARSGAFACLLTVPTNEGKFYFKASLGEQPSETRVTRHLGEQWPDLILPLVAADPQRNWMLMKDFRSLGYRELPASRYAEATRAFADLQIESSQSVAQLRQLGCPDFGLEQLVAFSSTFSAKANLLQAGTDAFEQHEVNQLLSKVSELGALGNTLAQYSLPETLANLDFRVENIAYGNKGLIYLDWRESVITQPFFSVLNMIDDFVPIEQSSQDIQAGQKQAFENRTIIQDAFLEAFTVYDSTERIKEAFSIASRLQPLMRLKRWFGYLEQLEPESFWANEFDSNQALVPVPDRRKTTAMNAHETLLSEGVELLKNGRPDLAVQRFERFTRLQPDNVSGWRHLAQAYNSIGSAQHAAGAFEAAATAYRAAVDADPGQKSAWNNLGSMLMILNRTSEAVKCFRKALEIDPDYAYALLNFGRYQLAAGLVDEAETSLLRSLKAEPRLGEAHLNLGNIYRQRRELNRAETSLRKALKLNPKHVNAWLMLADTYADMGMIDNSRHCYQKAIGANPASLHARMGLALKLPRIYRNRTELDETRAGYERGIRTLNEGVASYLKAGKDEKLTALQWNNFPLAYQGLDDRKLQEDFSRFQRTLLESALPRYYQPLERRPVEGRRLRVGFVSEFFYNSTVGKYFRSWITDLDTRRFETVVFPLHARSDQLTAEIRSASGTFHPHYTSLPELAQAVQEANLDVLIYPELGMNPRTFALANMRLAPLQCAAWGHPVTTGHDNIDLYISVDAMEPSGAQAHYTERLELLPGIGTSYSRPVLPEKASRESLGLPEDRILCLLPQSLFKIHPDNDALLAEILLREPSSTLVMFKDRQAAIDKQLVERFSQRFAQHEISATERIILMDRVSHDDFLRINLACDLMLDTLYWSGGNTALDALACALPVVANPGEFMRGRQSMAMLKSIGLEDLVVSSNDEYIDLALALCSDSERRNKISQRIASRNAELFDQQAPIEALESLLLSACSTRAC